MPRVHIPETVSDVTGRLAGIAGLLTAKQWERAAIVYAWTEPQVNQSAVRKSPQRMGLREFARLGIVGLKDPQQVRLYRAAWESAAEDGQASLDIKPGDDIDLPTLPWKDHFGEPSGEVQERVFRSVLNDPEAVSRAVKDNTTAAIRLADAVLSNPTARNVVQARLAEPIAPRVVEPWTPSAHDYRTDLVRAAGLISGLVKAAQSGEWEPTATESMLLHSLSVLIAGLNVGAESDPGLFDDIERYLAEATAR